MGQGPLHTSLLYYPYFSSSSSNIPWPHAQMLPLSLVIKQKVYIFH